MESKFFIRNAQKVKACLETLPTKRVVAKKEIKIYIPSRFEERNLAELGTETHIVGIYAMVVDNTYYAVSNINAMIRIEPSATLQVKIDGVDHYEFTFRPGDTVFTSLNLVKKDTLVYRIYDEIFSKGRVPWYMNYSDLGHIFDTASKHAGANIGQQVEVTELLVSMIARDRVDRTKYFRFSLKEAQEQAKGKLEGINAWMARNKPAFIPLKSVYYAATNTTNKLAGSYFSSGVVSALVSPSDRVERIEALLSQ